MGNSCTPQKHFRFKSLVVAVYPDDPADGPVKDALDRLESYVASNPERIPRVCRKISKLLSADLRRRRISRAVVGAAALRRLIAAADDAAAFAPAAVAVCAALFSPNGEKNANAKNTNANRAAAALLAALCGRLCDRPGAEQPRRLIAASADSLLPPLADMCADDNNNSDNNNSDNTNSDNTNSDNMNSDNKNSDNTNSDNMNSGNGTCGADAATRREALVAIGAAARCLRGALCDAAARLIVPPLQCLARAQSADSAAFAVAAVAGCVSAAAAPHFLRRVESFVSQRALWAAPAFARAAFWAVTRGMESRSRRLGFVVCEFLCRVIEEAAARAAADRVIGALRALTACAGEVSLSGDRPHIFFHLVRRAGPAVLGTEETVQTVVDLFQALARSAHRRKEALELHGILVGLLKQLEIAESEEANATVLLTLRALAMTVPFVRTFPVAQRDKIDVVGALEPHLRRRDAVQTWAARVLVNLIAGSLPLAAEPREETEDGDDEDDGVPEISDRGEAAKDTLTTDERDIVAAEQWVFATLADTTGATPCCVIEVGRVVTAVMQCRGIRALPFAMTVSAQLQDTGKHSSASAETTSEDAPALPPERQYGALQVAWAHLSLVVLANCGAVYGMPELTMYAMEVLEARRQAVPCELAQQFSPTLLTEPHGVVALQLAPDCDGHVLMSGTSESMSVVTSLISFDKVRDVVVESAAASPEVLSVFGIASGGDVRGAVTDVRFRRPAALGAASLSPAHFCRRPPPSQPFTFSLTHSKPRGKAATPGMHVICITDTANGEAAKETAAERTSVNDILARYGVSATTELLSAEVQSAPLPLPKLFLASPPSFMLTPGPVSNDRLLPSESYNNLHDSFSADGDNLHTKGRMNMITSHGTKFQTHSSLGVWDVDYNQRVSSKKTARMSWDNPSPEGKYIDMF